MFLLFVGSCALLPAACAQQAVPQRVKTKKPSQKAPTKEARPKAPAVSAEADPVLIFERTRCFGTCPAYSMRVFADGHIAYQGDWGVPILGPKELKLPPATLAEILRQAQKARFDQFKSLYSQNTSDLPSTIASIRQADGRMKTVVVEEGAPENVLAFFSYLTNQFDQLANLQAEK
ncbi:hypothetical protein IC235_20775 [Hymenobacter sp. BT664]|uniref:DUF6438 domain-containing protein n=1 Tax=Hymenobacter montanus TaxID=2771359 RepID=A0A927BHN4_9BACT|nr:DUF6438 domain-containing protein [Hymenobacter montanus]MBD2770329.1 hypothetical protein [Hymenobacter montanus]